MINKNYRLVDTFFCVNIFISSLLLFFIQPLWGKYLLPVFGGSFSVWTTAVLFFQTTLFLGYLYSYFTSKLGFSLQITVHSVLIVFSCAVTFIFKSGVNGLFLLKLFAYEPVAIFTIIAVNVGVPFFILSATSSMLQYWYGKIFPDKSPYYLFAFSNAGSFAGLLLYPFFFEWNFGLLGQVVAWKIMFLFYILLMMINLLIYKNKEIFLLKKSFTVDKNGYVSSDLDVRRAVLIVFFSFVPSVMLLAVTNYITQKITNMPVLWVIPLSIYLLTFIISFSEKLKIRENYSVFIYNLFFVCASISVSLLIKVSVIFHILSFLGILFATGIIFHTKVYTLRFETEKIPLFYIFVAFGGMLGGVFVNFIAPVLFRDFYEIYLVILLASAYTTFLLYKNFLKSKRRVDYFLFLFAVVLFMVGGALSLLNPLTYKLISKERNFYGTVEVLEGENKKFGKYYVMKHGHIIHGIQYENEALYNFPSSYYSPQSGVGYVILNHPKRNRYKHIRIGCIGLGIGVLASYGNRGDYIKFYEIDPDIVKIAKKYFTYIKSSEADIEIVVGDGRIMMERELQDGIKNNFDVLVLDAFSGGSVPVHLLTEEAFETYLRNIDEKEGIIAVNIINKYVNFVPVLKSVADRFGLELVIIEDKGIEGLFFQSSWVIMTKNRKFIKEFFVKIKDDDEIEKTDLWTDNYSSLLKLFKWK